MMSDLKFMVFNVDRGLCVFMRTPNDYGVMIDCGRTLDFSPILWLKNNEASSLKLWNGYQLTELIITHPHDDHVEDVSNLVKYFPPAILYRQKDCNWDLVLNPPDSDPSLNAKEFYKWQQTYDQPITQYPDFGLDIKLFSLTAKESEEIDPNLQHVLNNSSYVTVISYNTINGIWKLVVSGDNETKGWEKLLQRNDFRESIRNVSFFVTSHHGHESGFCSSLYEVMGKPWLNISSEKSGDQSVSTYYSSPDFAKGVRNGSNGRYHLTTRKDGSIVIKITDQGICTFDCINLDRN